MSQVTSMTLRALSLLLRHPPTVEAFLAAGLGPDVVQFAEAAASGANDATLSLQTVEMAAARLGQECATFGLMNAGYDREVLRLVTKAQSQADLDKVPHSPLTRIRLAAGSKVPTIMATNATCVVMEDPYTFAITDQLVSYRDCVSVIGSSVIPSAAHCYYFEIRIITNGQNPSRDTGVAFGLWPESLMNQTRGRQMSPGQQPGSYGWCATGDVMPYDEKQKVTRPEKYRFEENDVVQVLEEKEGDVCCGITCSKFSRVRKCATTLRVNLGKRGATSRSEPSHKSVGPPSLERGGCERGLQKEAFSTGNLALYARLEVRPPH